MTTDEYLYKTLETNRKRELHAGVVREPPAPYFAHQQVVLRIARLLCDHVEPRGLGRVGVAPVDVILDAERSIIVQPDVLFVSEARSRIIRNQVWGAPDLVVEVLSPGNRSYDNGRKLEWYDIYGVRECWLVDSFGETLTIVDFTSPAREHRLIEGTAPIRSAVLPDLEASGHRIFPA